MVRKLLCLLAAVLLLIPSAALAAGAVFDDANLFTASEIQELEAYIAQLRTDYDMDVLVLTSEDAPLNDSLDFADLFYENHASSEDGMVFFIDMKNRVPTISTSGLMIDYITDQRLDVLLDRGYDDLARGRYGSAAMAVLRQLDTYLRRGREEGSYRYDAVTGVQLTEKYNRLTSYEVAVAAVVGAAVAMIIVASVSGSYQLKGGTYHYSIGDNAARKLTRDEERFVTQRVTRQVRQPAPSSGGSSHSYHSSGRGSSVHHSSSGRSHGGGSGRKF